MEAKYLNWKYLDIVSDMFGFYDGNKYRKNTKFFKLLWTILSDDDDATPSIDDVFRASPNPYTKTSKVSMRYGIKRTGQTWLEGIDSDIFGERFQREYIRRWNLANDLVQ